jgi:hypothetical protein
VYDVLNGLGRELLESGSKEGGVEGKEMADANSKIKNLVNNVILLEHLHKLIGDLNQVFHVP